MNRKMIIRKEKDYEICTTGTGKNEIGVLPQKLYGYDV
jgi:hypothetical protein